MSNSNSDDDKLNDKKLNDDKLKTALNYYLYTMGNKDICREGFDSLTSDTYIKEKLKNFKKMSCMYNKANKDDLTQNIIKQLSKEPNEIISYLKKDKNVDIEKNNDELKKAQAENKTKLNNHNSKLDSLNKQIATTQEGIITTQKALQKLELERDDELNQRNEEQSEHEEKVYNIKQKDIDLKEKNYEIYGSLIQYEDAGYELNKFSIHLDKIISNRRKQSIKKYSLLPDRLCRVDSKYTNKNDKCVCIGEKLNIDNPDEVDEEIPCDPANCSISSECTNTNSDTNTNNNTNTNSDTNTNTNSDSDSDSDNTRTGGGYRSNRYNKSNRSNSYNKSNKSNKSNRYNKSNRSNGYRY
jgi:hypothetical protein